MRGFLALSLLWLLMPCVRVSAQSSAKIDNDLVFNKAKYNIKKVALAAKHGKKLEFPLLDRIEVIDARGDTSCIGFRNRYSVKNNQILQFQNGLKREFEVFFKSLIKFKKDSAAYSAILVVRNYWINEFEVDENESDKFSENRSGRYSARKTAMRATFDFYLTKNNEYFVAYRFDTVATAFLNIKEFSETYPGEILQAGLRRLQTITPDAHIANKRIFTRTELEGYYEQRWDKPILKETEFEKGVYKNFTEFLNNRPSILRFVVKKDKLVDVLYVPLNGDQLGPARDVWGYCDGKNFFIKSGENYYVLVRVQNAFYFLGSKELMKSQDEYYNYDPYTGQNMRVTSDTYLSNRLFPMKLDMEKGVAY